MFFKPFPLERTQSTFTPKCVPETEGWGNMDCMHLNDFVKAGLFFFGVLVYLRMQRVLVQFDISLSNMRKTWDMRLLTILTLYRRSIQETSKSQFSNERGRRHLQIENENVKKIGKEKPFVYGDQITNLRYYAFLKECEKSWMHDP